MNKIVLDGTDRKVLRINKGSHVLRKGNPVEPFIREVGLDAFNEALEKFPDLREYLPKKLQLSISCDGTNCWVNRNGRRRQNSLHLEVPLGTTTEEILSLPDVTSYPERIQRRYEQAEQEAEEKEWQRLQSDLKHMEEMESLLEGATFLRVQSKRQLVFLSPEGEEILVESSYDDSLRVASN